MRKSTAGFLLSGFLVLAVVSLLSAQSASQNPRWEYAAYEMTQGIQGDTQVHFYWHTRQGSVHAEGKRFRLFRKLGIQTAAANTPGIVLWNHMGDQGWEYVAQFDETSALRLRAVTVFRRPVN